MGGWVGQLGWVGGLPGPEAAPQGPPAPPPPPPLLSKGLTWASCTRKHSEAGRRRPVDRGAWASRMRKHSEAGYGRPVDRGAWTAKSVKRPRQQPAQPQYANYWAPLTCKRHTMPHPAQPQHTNYWAPRTRKRHQQEHRPQWPTESSDPRQHAKGRTGDCPGPRKETKTRRNVTQGGEMVVQGSRATSLSRTLTHKILRVQHTLCREAQDLLCERTT